MTNPTPTELAYDAYAAGEVILNGDTYEVIGMTEFESRLEDSIGDLYDDVQLLGVYTYSHIRVLRAVDPIVYRQLELDEIDRLAENNVLVYGENLVDCIRLADTVEIGE